MKKRIAVVGNDGKISGELEDAAELIGKNIAERDCVLVCGGRGGVMEAACCGAKKAGGITVGILPSLEKNDANRHVDVAVTTGMNYARNSLVVSSADAVIALCGSIGTLSEIALALNYCRPVIVVEEFGGCASRVRRLFEGDPKAGKIYSTKASSAVEKALKAIG